MLNLMSIIERTAFFVFILGGLAMTTWIGALAHQIARHIMVHGY